MRTITKTVRTFEEMIEAAEAKTINQNALEKARTWMQQQATSGEWYEYTKDFWKQILDQIGFTDAEISFSGFWCQGDGASFTCNNVDVTKLASFLSTKREAKDHVELIDDKEEFRSYLIHKLGWKGIDFESQVDWIAHFGHHFNAQVERLDNRYSHEYTCRFVMYHNYYECVTAEVLDDFEKQAESLREALSKLIYSDLEKDYYAQTADDALIEMDGHDEFTFDETGSREG